LNGSATIAELQPGSTVTTPRAVRCHLATLTRVKARRW
jgi:hypothetical protein